MIKRSEVARRARDLGLQEAHVMRDYVLNHVLASISQGLGDLAFRGGTALARVYWPDYRLSEDLDFIALHRSQDLEERLQRAVEEASERTRITITVRRIRGRDDWYRWAVESDAGLLQVDLNVRERAYLPVQKKVLSLPYSDLSNATYCIATLDLCEILANKYYMLTDREEPRDLFDLWWGLEKEAIQFDRIADAHRVKYGHDPSPRAMKEVVRVADLWEQHLSHQIRDLPAFSTAVDDVRRRVAPETPDA